MKQNTLESARTLALGAVGFLATDEDLLDAFMAQSGLSPADFYAHLQKDFFLASVLDFLLTEDQRVIAACEKLSCKPDHMHRAYYQLSGSPIG